MENASWALNDDVMAYEWDFDDDSTRLQFTVI